jgi:hypothetical protein
MLSLPESEHDTMAWVTITPNPQGGASNSGGSCSGWADFSTYRVFRGAIRARLLDVSYSNGYQFSAAEIDFQLVNSAGAVRAGASLTKLWGVTPGWTTLGAVSSGGESLRFRITASRYYSQNAPCTWYNFVLQIAYDSTLG